MEQLAIEGMNWLNASICSCAFLKHVSFSKVSTLQKSDYGLYAGSGDARINLVDKAIIATDKQDSTRSLPRGVHRSLQKLTDAIVLRMDQDQDDEGFKVVWHASRGNHMQVLKSLQKSITVLVLNHIVPVDSRISFSMQTTLCADFPGVKACIAG